MDAAFAIARDLPNVMGPLFVTAVAALALGVFVEQAGAALRFTPDEKPPEGLGAFALMVVTALSPGLLLVHAFIVTMSAPDGARAAAMGLVIAAVIVGAIAGRLAGGAWQSGARFMRAAALPVNVVALLLAVYTSRPSLAALYDLLTTGQARLSAPGL